MILAFMYTQLYKT